jgi:hypothetical protein
MSPTAGVPAPSGPQLQPRSQAEVCQASRLASFVLVPQIFSNMAITMRIKARTFGRQHSVFGRCDGY